MYRQSIADMNDAQLLQSFAEQNSEAAFRSLVERHLPLVFGTARRMTGDNALAEDIAQTVFILLAGKAKRLGRDTILSGWLYRTTRFVTARALTSEQRRRRREQEALTMQSSIPSDSSWLRLGPQLDDALARLGETDRNAILLRYFEQQSLRDVGLALGLSEEAAKKRVARALEKLRRTLSRHGAEISAAALAAGLTKEAAEAASALPLAGKIAAVVLAHGAAGAGAAGSALLTDVLAALRWAQIQTAAVILAALIAAGVVLPPAARYWQRAASSSAAGTNSSALARGLEPIKPATRPAAPLASAPGPARSLLVTVLDAETSQPIQGAALVARVNGPKMPEFQNPFITRPDGTARLPIPENVPGELRVNGFSIDVDAPGYATRIISWTSSTGMVLNIVADQHTVRLSRGVTLAGVAVDDAGKPLAGVRFGAIGNNFDGDPATEGQDAQGRLVRTPAVHQSDYSSYYLSIETNLVVTDAAGRFKLENYPGDVRALCLDLQTPEGASYKFGTAEGLFVCDESLPKLSLSELKRGAARLILPRGVTVQGIVVNNAGLAIAGAKVVEADEYGNLNVLSQNETDAAGRFCLSNRPLREVILGVSAPGSASISAIVSIQPGMEPVRLELPPELPLRGQVINEAGLPLASANVDYADYLNPGQCANWSAQTDSNGRFYWQGAPTNELALLFSAPGHANRVVRLRASTNESVITLHSGDNETVHITGDVTDADSGTPLDHFQVKVSHQMMSPGNIPRLPSQDFGGNNGDMNIELMRKDFPIGFDEAWIMTIEAEGYDAAVSRIYELEEGDQQLDFKLKPGGTVEGIVRTPAGEPAAGAQLAFAVYGSGSMLCSAPGRLARDMSTNNTAANGQFKLKKPLLPRNLIIFHEAGWAVVPVTAGPQKADVTLSPWARIEGTLAIGNQPASGRQIILNNLEQDFADALYIYYIANCDDEGRFVFDKLPPGTFKLSCRAVGSGKWDVSTMQTSVTVTAGETKTVEMAAGGRTVAAQLQAPPGLAAINWSNALATLSTDVQVPPEPSRNDFITEEAHEAAHFRYAHDPAVLAALEKQKTFAGSVGPEGMAVFEQVPPGDYILEVKLFDPSRRTPLFRFDNEPAVVIARLRAAVAVPEAAAPSANAAPAPLGDFPLDPL
jgi:RNA polymerase sigma factor (sigma-70 family)